LINSVDNVSAMTKFSYRSDTCYKQILYATALFIIGGNFGDYYYVWSHASLNNKNDWCSWKYLHLFQNKL